VPLKLKVPHESRKQPTTKRDVTPLFPNRALRSFTAGTNPPPRLCKQFRTQTLGELRLGPARHPGTIG